MTTLIEYVRATFGLDPIAPATLTPGRRGALGAISRLEIGSRGFAIKELFDDEAPAPALIAAELEFTGRATVAGVRVAASYPATDGRYAVPTPDGRGWLRLYDWLDADPLDPGSESVPVQLGTLLGRLHACAPASDREPDGSAPDEWYDIPPAVHGWSSLIEAATGADVAWAGALAERLPLIETLTALATPADPNRMVTCHRDLHPENVLVLASGTIGAGDLAVIDWDDLGPADPSRELVRVLLDWFFDDDVLNVEAVRGMLAAYRATGAPGRIRTDTFGLAIASRLNFLQRQIGIALDTAAEQRHRRWAEREIDEALRVLPAPAVLAQLVDVDS